MPRLSRRSLLGGLAAAPLVAAPAVLRAETAARVVVVGGGYGGTVAAKYLKRAWPALPVTLVEPSRRYVTPPYGNQVIAGWRGLESITFGYEALAGRWGIEVIHDRAEAIDPQARQVRLAGGGTLPYDRLILSPGIAFRSPDEGGIEGYDEAAAEAMPHAWTSGGQADLLRRRLEAMPEGGLYLISAPPNPGRCPPAPYERASLVADYFAKHNPSARILILDAKETMSMQPLFEAAWARFYPDTIERYSQSGDGTVVRVDAETGEVESEFGEIYEPDVANVIPPQMAARIAQVSGLVDASGWCPVEPLTLESTLMPGIHVIGDAALASPMPKSGFAANSQGKAAAATCVALLRDEEPPEPAWLSACYSHLAPDYAISIVGLYRPGPTGFEASHEGGGGSSPLDWPDEKRALEAGYADAWYASSTADMFT